MPKQIRPDSEHSLGFNGNELVFMMGEELKKPLSAIKALAESGAADSQVGLEARKAMRTIDNILLYQQITQDQTRLQFEPVHVGSTLTHVATHLKPLSTLFGCETEVYIQSGLAPVDADRRILQSGLESMWQAMLGMTSQPSPLTWQITRHGSGIRIAVTNRTVDLSKVRFSTAMRAGSSRQPFSGVAGPATDLVAARGLFGSLGIDMHKIRRNGRAGFAVTLPMSPQLALV